MVDERVNLMVGLLGLQQVAWKADTKGNLSVE